MINRNPDICGGSPTIAGRRITVANVVSHVKDAGIEITQQDLRLTFEQIIEALSYCSELKCIQNSEGLPFCQHCALRGLCPESLIESGFLESKRFDNIEPIHQKESECISNWSDASNLLTN